MCKAVSYVMWVIIRFTYNLITICNTIICFISKGISLQVHFSTCTRFDAHFLAIERLNARRGYREGPPPKEAPLSLGAAPPPKRRPLVRTLVCKAFQKVRLRITLISGAAPRYVYEVEGPPTAFTGAPFYMWAPLQASEAPSSASKTFLS